MSAKISPVGILSYPSLFTARPNPQRPDAEPEYSCVLVFPPEAQQTSAFKLMKQQAREAATDHWGDKIPPNLRNPLRDTSDNENMATQFPAGSVYVRLKSKFKPGVVDPAAQEINIPSDVFAGQHARASYSARAYDVNGNKGVSFVLNNVQIAKMSGVDRLDGRRKATDEFDKLVDDSDAVSDMVDEDDVFA